MNGIFLDEISSIDANQASSNLIAAGGTGKSIIVYDKRNSKIVKVFETIHSSNLLSI